MVLSFTCWEIILFFSILYKCVWLCSDIKCSCFTSIEKAPKTAQGKWHHSDRYITWEFWTNFQLTLLAVVRWQGLKTINRTTTESDKEKKSNVISGAKEMWLKIPCEDFSHLEWLQLWCTFQRGQMVWINKIKSCRHAKELSLPVA